MMLKRMKNYLLVHRHLIIQLIKRETFSRYKGSYLGLLWTVLTPLLMLVVYTVVFSEIFQSRWHSDQTNKLEFAIIVFCGLATFNIFSEVVSKSPSLILSNVNYVKKVVFPLEILSLVAIGAALVNAAINYSLIILFALLFMNTLNWTIVLLPFVLLPIILFSLGMSWFLSSLGVYLRDIGHVIGIIVQALMLLSPIFYSLDIIPNNLKWFYYINPIVYFVEDARKILIWGVIPDIGVYIIQVIIALLVCIFGLFWFIKTKKGFADVL